MNLLQFKSFFYDKKITYAQINDLLSKNKQIYEQLRQLYKSYCQRFTFKVFVKYFILDKHQQRCLKCNKLLTYKQLKDGRKYCSNKCSNNDQVVKRKIRESNYKKYGFGIASKSYRVIEKIKTSRQKKMNFDFEQSLIDKIENEQSFYQQNLFSDSLFCNIGKSYHTIVKQVYDFVVTQSSGDCTCFEKNILPNVVFDVYCSQQKFAIQILRTKKLTKDNYKCTERSFNPKLIKMCQENGIRIIHVLQKQWEDKQKLVQDRIKSLLGNFQRKIYARNCYACQIKHDLCNSFLQNNHIQGKDLSKVRFGLFQNGQLVAVMTFGKPRFNERYQWQLIRYASKLGCQVVGGASKLLKCFERMCIPKNIISYADRRYSNGKLYYALGFDFLVNSYPNYWWCRDNIKLTRYQCQKHRLQKLLGKNFNPKISENNNMINNGFCKVYDCGNMVFGKVY